MLVVIAIAVVFFVFSYYFAPALYDWWDAKLAVWFDVGKIKVRIAPE